MKKEMKYNLDPNKQTNLFLRKLNEQDKTIQQVFMKLWIYQKKIILIQYFKKFNVDDGASFNDFAETINALIKFINTIIMIFHVLFFLKWYHYIIYQKFIENYCNYLFLIISSFQFS